MALSLQDGTFVWQKVKKALNDADPSIQNAFFDLRVYLSTQGGNLQLQFIPFTSAQAVVNNGTDLVGAACTLYAVYWKAKRTSGTTAAFLAIHDAADNSATTTTIVTARIKATGNKGCAIEPTGIALATGCTISCATAVGGSTESSDADAANGFVIVGA